MRTNFDYPTELLQAQDQAHNIHPFSDPEAIAREGVTVMAEGEGIYVYDSQGNRLIDGIGGLWCVSLGHGREEMAQAVADQIRRLDFFSVFNQTTNPPAAELSDRLAGYAPGTLSRIFLSTSGSNANETAIRAAHYYFRRKGQPAKRHIIARHGGYHGSSYLTAALCGPDFHAGWVTLDDLIQYVSAPHTYHRPADMTEEAFCDAKVQELEDLILKLGPENVACFIAEPILGASGVIVPPRDYPRRTREVCANHDVLYISDEVVTGFGRLGHIFASEPVFDLVPDILTCAKGISSGVIPLAATLFAEEIFEVIAAPGGIFAHGYTYTAHPVACVAGLKTLEIMEREGLCAHVRELGPYFMAALDGLRDLELVGDVRGSHFMAGIEYVADRATREPVGGEVDVGRWVWERCLARGLIVRPVAPQVNSLSPPLILTRTQIDEVVAILRAAIRETMDDLIRAGHWSPKG
jgi:adenosylmethionine-8-amino-7-oxononanoate aminotransferase